MHLGALPADAAQVLVRIGAEDLVHLPVVEGGVQAAGKALGEAAGAPAAAAGEREQRLLRAGGGEPYGPRKLGVEQQELGDAGLAHVRGVMAAVGLERR